MANARKTLAAFVALMVGATNGVGIVSQTVAYADDNSDTSVTYLQQFVGQDVTSELTDEQKMQLIKDSMDTSKVEELNLPDKDDEVWVIVELQDDSLVQKVAEKMESGISSTSVSKYAESDEGQAFSENLLSAQGAVKQELASSGIKAEYKQSYTAALNGFSAKVRYGDIEAIKRLKNVKDVVLSSIYFTDDINEDEESSISPSADIESYDAAENYDGQYNGAGMVVGIVDTGLDTNHSAFQKAPYKTKMTKEKISELIPKTLANSAIEFSADDVYVNAKVPYVFDYADVDTDVCPTDVSVERYGNDHGTHVAGITAGNDEEITGVAPEAQLMIFKVFSDKSSGASTNDILAGLNDAVIMGVDSINMSLGSSGGFASEESDSLITEIYNNVTSAGINLVTSAGNAYSSAYGAADSDYPLTSNPDTGIIGSPSSYSNSLSVASIDATSSKTFKVGDTAIRYNEIAGHEFANELEKTSYEYVMVPGAGLEEDYKDLDVTGKIAVIKRGSATFTAKEEMAAAKGAAGCIIYNNRDGYVINMSVENATIPTVSISKSAGETMALAENKTLTIPEGDSKGNKLMSDFSSWGPLPSLELKPEITGPGGNIYSSLPFGKYGYMSGTSMSSPWVAGATAVVKQYVNSQYPNLSTKEARILVNRLLMSTAVPTTDDRGVLYSPRKQGAGVANIGSAVATDAYLYVYGQERPKLELGDDKEEKGEYTLSFHLKNMGRSSLSYDLGASVLTESVTADGKYISQQAHSFDDAKVEIISVSNASLDGKTVTVSGNQDASITMKVTLTEADKEYMRTYFENGIYVEGFVSLTAKDDGGVDLSLPYLAFFGDWTKAPLLDTSIYDDEEPQVAASYATSILGGMYMFKAGEYVLKSPDGMEVPKPSAEKISIGLNRGNGVGNLGYSYLGLMRGAKEVTATLKDKATGKIAMTSTTKNVRKARYNSNTGTMQLLPAGDFYPGLNEYGDEDTNTELVCDIKAYADYPDPQKNSSSTWSYPVYIDYEYPAMTNADNLKAYKGDDGRIYMDVIVRDNRYVMGGTLYTYYEGYDYWGNFTRKPGENYYDYVQPVYDSAPNKESKLTFDVTDVLNNLVDGKFYVILYDYALNESTFLFQMPVTKVTGVTLDKTEAEMKLHDTLQLNANITPEDASNKNVKWYTSSSKVAKVVDGLVTSFGEGDVVITAATEDGNFRATCNIKVTSEEGPGVKATGIKVSPETLSVQAGQTGTLKAVLEPWNVTDTKVTWTSSDENIAKVENGTVIGIAEGNATIKATAASGVSSTAEVTVTEAASAFEISDTTLVKYNGADLDVIVPEGITVIGDGAFKNSAVTSVKLPESVTDIESNAFYKCQSLKSVTMPSKLNSIGASAFYYCNKLESIVVPEGVKELPKYAFSGCSGLLSVSLPDTLTTMYDSVFNNCSSLKSIVLPNSLNTFEGTHTFSSCKALESVTLSDSMTYIPQSMFLGCTSLKSIDLKNVTELRMFAFQATGFETFEVPETVTKLDNRAFALCKSLESVNFKGICETGDSLFYGDTNLKSVTGGITVLGKETFYGCTALTEFKVPQSVRAIGDKAFRKCTNLTKVIFPKDGQFKATETAFGGLVKNIFADCPNFTGFEVEEGNEYLSVLDGDLYDKEIKFLLALDFNKMVEELTIPDTVEEIGPYLCYSNTDLKMVNFPKSLKKIDRAAFYGCKGLTSIDLPDGVEYIGAAAFQNCSLSGFDFGNSLREIGEYAFYTSSAVKGSYNIVLPDTLKTIGERAFYGQRYVTAINLGKGVESIGEYSFNNCAAAESITLSENLKTIGNSAFYGCKAAKEINLPDGLETIGERAFYGCNSLKAIVMPDTVKSVGKYAFYGCYAVENLKISNSLTELTAYVFANMNSNYSKYGAEKPVTEVFIPASVEVIDTKAFYGCNYLERFVVDPNNKHFANTEEGLLINLDESTIWIWPSANETTEFTLPRTMTKISDSMFRGKSIRKITIPGTINEIGKSAFRYSDIEEVVFEDSTNGGLVIESYAFADCDNLKSITLPYGTTSLGSYIFSNDENLVKVEMPDTVTNLGSYAFTGCSALTDLRLSNSIAVINTATFNKCENLAAITLPSSLQFIDYTSMYRPFDGCTNLKSLNIADDARYYKTVDGVLFDKEGKELSFYPVAKDGENYVIPEGVARIESKAFANNLNLKEVSLPSTMQRIGDKAFYGCYNLKNYDFNSDKAPVLEVDTYLNTFKRALYGNFYDNYYTWDEDYNIIYTEMDLAMTYPEGGVDYDSYLYDIFFKSKVEKTIQNMLSVKNLTAVMGDDHAVTLNWDSAPWAENYKVERAEIKEVQIEGTDMATGKAKVETVNAYNEYTLLGNVTETTFVDKNTELGKKYMYKVTPYMDKEATQGVPGTVAIIIEGINDDEKAAAEVIRLIDKIQDPVTLESEEDIIAARKAYDKLTDKQKAYVYNYGKLLEAEEALKELKLQHMLNNLVKLCGSSRYTTATEVSKAGWQSSEYAVLASGEAYADALVSAPLASYYDAPVLLTGADKLTEATRTELERLGVETVFIVGGTAVISNGVQKELANMNISAMRFDGKDRYETSLKVAKFLDKVTGNTNTAYVVGGYAEADAVSIASKAAAEKQPIILTGKDTLNEDTMKWLRDKNLKAAYVIGGTDVVADEVLESLNAITADDISGNRLWGEDRYGTNAAVIDRFYKGNMENVIVAKGDPVVDALVAAPYAGKTDSPIVIAGSKLVESQKDAIDAMSSPILTQIGGGVSEGVVNEIAKLLCY